MVIFILALVVPFFIHKNIYFKLSALQVTRLVYGMNPFPESFEVAKYIRDHSEEMDKIAVFGSEPEIYFYSKRRAATRHIYMFPLMEPQIYARDMQTELIRDVEDAHPKFIVLVHLGESWVSPKQHMAPTLIEWSYNYLDSNYQIQGIVDIFGVRESVYKWGRQAREYQVQSRYHLLIYQKRT